MNYYGNDQIDGFLFFLLSFVIRGTIILYGGLLRAFSEVTMKQIASKSFMTSYLTFEHTKQIFLSEKYVKISLLRHLLQLSELENGRSSSACNFCVESKIEKYSCYLRNYINDEPP